MLKQKDLLVILTSLGLSVTIKLLTRFLMMIRRITEDINTRAEQIVESVFCPNIQGVQKMVIQTKMKPVLQTKKN